MSTAALEAVQQLRAQREEIVRELSQLSDADCRYPAQWAGITRTVNFLLRAFSLHDLDHGQHLQRLLAARGHQFGEAQLLLAKAHGLRAELEALLLSLSDEEFEATGPGPDDWSARQLVEHLTQIDARYRQNTRLGVEQGRSGAAAPPAGPAPAAAQEPGSRP